MFKLLSTSCETFTYPTSHAQAGVTSAGPCVLVARDVMVVRIKLAKTNACLFIYKYFIFLFIFRARGREGEREGEKYQCVVASRIPPPMDLAHNLGMCALTGN